MPTGRAAVSLSIGLILSAVFSAYWLAKAIAGTPEATGLPSTIAHNIVRDQLDDLLKLELSTDRLKPTITALVYELPAATIAKGAKAQGPFTFPQKMAELTAGLATRLDSKRGQLADRLSSQLPEDTLRGVVNDVVTGNGKETGLDSKRVQAAAAAIRAHVTKQLPDKDIGALTSSWANEVLKDPVSQAAIGRLFLKTRNLSDRIAQQVERLNLGEQLSTRLAKRTSPLTVDAASISTTSRELRARVLWATAALMFAVAWSAAVLVSLSRVATLLTGGGKYVSVLAIALIAGVLGYASYDLLSGHSRFAPDLPQQLLGYFSGGAGINIDHAADIFNGLAVAVAVIVVLSCWIVTAVDLPGSDGLTKQVESLRLIFNVGAVVLVAGVMEIAALYEWPIAFFDEPNLVKAFEGVVNAEAMAAGAFFSLVLLAGYLPASSVLRVRARALKKKDITALLVAELNKADVPGETPTGKAERIASAVSSAIAAQATLEASWLGESSLQLGFRVLQAFSPLLVGVPLSAALSSILG